MLTNLLYNIGWADALSILSILQHTPRDPTHSSVMHFCELGWSTNMSDAGQDGFVSPMLRPRSLVELHMGHSGSSCMKELVCSYVW